MATNRTARLRRLEEAITPSSRIFTIIDDATRDVEVEEQRLRDEEVLDRPRPCRRHSEVRGCGRRYLVVQRVKLRLGRRLCAHVTRRSRELHHLGDRPRVDPKPSRRRAMAQPLNLKRVANAPIKLHALHPPPCANPTQRDICCRTFAPALPENPAASVRDYCSGAHIPTRPCRGHVERIATRIERLSPQYFAVD